VEVIKTKPNENNFEHFEALPLLLYPKESISHKQSDVVDLNHLHCCFVLLQENKPIARLSLYFNPFHNYRGETAACIGHYECIEDEKASQTILAAAEKQAKSNGVKFLIGPMNGSTWNNYRFSAHNDHRNFFLEAYNHVYYNEQWTSAGFESIMPYISNLDTQLKVDGEKLVMHEKRFTEKGAVFRNIKMDDVTSELHKIGKFSIEAFSDNLLYSPIKPEEFVAKYQQVAPLMKHEFVWLVEDENQELHAVMFAIPDYFDPDGKTLIIKSLARKKETPFKGIGSFLTGKITQQAKEKGYTAVIHALMIADKASERISEKYAGTAYKRYNLYGKKVSGE
jgi:hypothetical protein